MRLEPGQNTSLADTRVTVTMQVNPAVNPLELDASAYLLTESGKVPGDEGMLFYGQASTVGGAAVLHPAERRFEFDLARVPANIQRIALTLTIDKGTQRQQRFGMLTSLLLSCKAGSEEHEFQLNTQSMAETALIFAELYRRDGKWKLRAVGQGFFGGLGPLAKHFGVDISDDPEAAPAPAPAPPPAPAPAPAPRPPAPPAPAPAPPPAAPPAPPIQLSKITLEKRTPISLQKPGGAFGEIVVNLNWVRPGAGFLGIRKPQIDLDLGCMIELHGGGKAVVQALGNSFGNLAGPPFARLMADDRTGASLDGEFLKINGDQWSQIRRVLIFAFIYEGTPSWAKADAVISLRVPGQPELLARLDSHSDRHGMCAVAMLENVNSAIQVSKLVEYFAGHPEMDRQYGFGFRWTAGSK